MDLLHLLDPHTYNALHNKPPDALLAKWTCHSALICLELGQLRYLVQRLEEIELSVGVRSLVIEVDGRCRKAADERWRSPYQD